MKLYVAGSSRDAAHVSKVIDFLETVGHKVTLNWTKVAEFDTNGEADVELEQLIAFAEADLKAVQDTDAVVLCCHPDLAGAYIEVGAALAARPRKQIFVIGQQRWTIFYRLPEVHLFDSYMDFFAYMERVVK